MLTLYAICVEIKGEILTAEPGLIKTCIGTEKTKPKFTVKSPAFRPKNSADYRAQVKTQEQTKRRRHEALLDMFAAAIKTAGMVAANNVHPCDLTVDGHGKHWLVEAKTVGLNAEEAVRAAIGQLFTYRHFCYRELRRQDPALVALFSEPIGDAFSELLVTLGIEAIWRSNATWHGASPAGQPGLRQYLA
jgi:hypothetical protein